MEGLKGLKIAAGVLVSIGVLGLVFIITRASTGYLKDSISSVNDMSSKFGSTELDCYNNEVVKGQELLDSMSDLENSGIFVYWITNQAIANLESQGLRSARAKIEKFSFQEDDSNYDVLIDGELDVVYDEDAYQNTALPDSITSQFARFADYTDYSPLMSRNNAFYVNAEADFLAKLVKDSEGYVEAVAFIQME